MNKQIKDLTDKQFGRLVVVCDSGKRGKNRAVFWLCRCTCGNLVYIRGNSLVAGKSQSCGCLQKEEVSARITGKTTHHYKHGLARTPLYERLMGIKTRCNNSNQKQFKNYGGRGIQVCPEWLDKETGVIRWFELSLANGYKTELTIDRINNNKGYSPDNCQWISRVENIRKSNKERRI